jgi:RNA polymerase sigma factor (TIGR02999 family)
MAESGMHDSSPGAVRRLLGKVRAGDRSAFNELFPLVYEELRKLAHEQRRHWRGHDTLNTTTVIHEAYLKLAAQPEPDWETRAHFLAVAAKAMRQVLIDYARSRAAQKRGGDRIRVSLEDLDLTGSGEQSSAHTAEALIALDEALKRLERRNERYSRIVECRFFGGLTIRDTGAALGISPATVARGWALAKRWLYRDMQRALTGKATEGG